MKHRVWVPGPTHIGAWEWLQYSSNFFWNNKNRYEWLKKNVERINYTVYVQREPEFGWWIEFKYNRDAVAFKLYWGGDETDNQPPA
jgi:hypothetical protein